VLWRAKRGVRRLQIELVNICNYRCPLCRTLVDDDVPRRRMTLDELSTVIQPVARQLTNVTLYGTRGEPFVHPELEAAIGLVKRTTRASVDVSTNGSLITEARAQKVLDSGLDRIIFAVDGLSQRSYERYRVGGELARVLDNIERLCALGARGGYGLQVVLQLIPMSTNEHELADLPALAGRLGVDVVRLKHSSSVARSREYRPIGGLLVDSPTAARGDETHSGQHLSSAEVKCPFGSDKLYVDPNGDVFACCYGEGRPSVRLGNAFESSVSDLWSSELAVRIRRGLAGQRPVHAFCAQTCADRRPVKKVKLPVLRNSACV